MKWTRPSARLMRARRWVYASAPATEAKYPSTRSDRRPLPAAYAFAASPSTSDVPDGGAR